MRLPMGAAEPIVVDVQTSGWDKAGVLVALLSSIVALGIAAWQWFSGRRVLQDERALHTEALEVERSHHRELLEAERSRQTLGDIDRAIEALSDAHESLLELKYGEGTAKEARKRTIRAMRLARSIEHLSSDLTDAISEEAVHAALSELQVVAFLTPVEAAMRATWAVRNQYSGADAS